MYYFWLVVPVGKGGLDDIENLKHLHSACHKQVHSKPKLKGLRRMMGNCQVRFLGEGRIVMSNPYPATKEGSGLIKCHRWSRCLAPT
ncbi:HNH endonuclease [Cylindrospermopsis raciborskii]|uniref:HNH endonuclease n=1 Tax=Cylindrospermopsis raciborskii TaxID=77022 RepID=UPI0039BDF684